MKSAPNIINIKTKEQLKLTNDMTTIKQTKPKLKLFLFLLLFASALTFTLPSCGDNITGPVQPGRRDYVWTVDTLNYPYNTITRMWGNTPTDVWSISSGGDLDKTIFHFDGNKWTTDGISRPISPHSIFGFSSNNVFIGGSNGRIWQFDGNGWKQIAELTKDGNTQIVFDNMWGGSQNDLYAFGAYADDKGLANNSVIAHLNNNKWTMLNTDGLVGIVEQLYNNRSDNKIYIQVIKFSNTFDSTFIYEYNQGNYTKLYSTIWDKYWATISLINNEVYFVLRTEIAKRVNNQFQTVLKLDNTNFRRRIWGRNSNDIFLEMNDGLAHYNGNDIKYLFKHNQSNVSIFGAALFDKEIFFLVYEFTTNLNLIYHGKLKE